MLKEVNPGMSVNIVADVNVDKETTEVRNAIVYDVNGTTLLLSQTNPPFTKYHISNEIAVTYVAKSREGVGRIGFVAKLTGIVDNYNLSGSSIVQALAVLRKSRLKAYDLRMHYRVCPRSYSGINLHIGQERISPIDISMGGARFCHSKDHPTESRTIIKLILELDADKFDIEAKTISVWYITEAGRRTDLEYVSVQFMNLDKECGRILGGKILAIQRELLSENCEV